MNRWIALAAAAALLAGCAGSPARLPGPAEPLAASAPVSTGSEAAASVSSAAGNGTADAAGGSELGPETPASDVGHETPASDVRGEPTDFPIPMLRVPEPALADLPADLRAELPSVSAWEAAQRAALWRHGATLAVPLAIAPALIDQLLPARPADVDRVWVRLVSADESDDAFYFHVEVTRRDGAGRLELAGSDVVAVSRLEGGLPLVTGYANGASEPAGGGANGQAAVWVGASPESLTPPELLNLPAPVVTDAEGNYLVPEAALEAVWEVTRVADGSAALVLGDGVRSAALPLTDVGDLPYVRVADLIAAVDGVRLASADASYTYAVEWRPDLGQLCLWRDAQHPIS